jgi:phospholipase C
MPLPRHLATVTALTALLLSALPSSGAADDGDSDNTTRTATPIKHLVVIFQENVSFDHYFATYPRALNPTGEPAFHAAPDTPNVNGLNGPLLTNNPNLANPQRLSRAQAATCDQDHGYTHEQQAYDRGGMDMFVQFTGRGPTLQQCLTTEGNPAPADGSNPNYAVLDYFDGNTVTALWNYAQHFAMSDNSYSDTFGPSTPGALNVTSGNTFGAVCGPTSAVFHAPACTAAPGQTTSTHGAPAALGPGTTYSDADPNFDICSATQDGKTAAQTIQMGGKNIGDLLSAEGLSWGWFQGGFASPNYTPGDPNSDDLSVVCTSAHKNVLGVSQLDYNPHHQPFQYFASTANPKHLPPTSIAAIGQQDQANHQYDLKDFFAALDHKSLPAVSYLKAADYQDGHAGYSDPLDEQAFLASTINALEKSSSWLDTAVIVLYDDSDGWYDHQAGPLLTESQTTLDNLTASGQCGATTSKVPDGQPARCGVGMRQPLLVISPFSRSNFVDHTVTTQASVVQFIEDNWLGGQRVGSGSADAFTGTLSSMFEFQHRGDEGHRLLVDPSTGEPE